MILKMNIRANLVDVVGREVFPAELVYENGCIVSITRIDEKVDGFLVPGLVDSHVHIESSMVTPAAFSRAAVCWGTVGTVSDPHEIANVLGRKGLDFMLKSAQKVNFYFNFGVPSCVPATDFETSGARLDAKDVEELLSKDEFLYLSEMMNFPGVIFGDENVGKKLKAAQKYNKPVDGHAPGLKGDDLRKYVAAGVQTDHECSTLDEAREKAELGMEILIREGSAAKNFESLLPLLKEMPDKVMFCSDDLHPDDLVKGHMNLLVKRAISKGYDLFDVLRAVSYNPVKFYNLNIGLLQKGDSADFILVDNLDNFNVLETYIRGEKVYDNGKNFIPEIKEEPINSFFENKLSLNDISIPSGKEKIKVIEALDGELLTKTVLEKPLVKNNVIVSDIEKDVLKLVALNRYQESKPSVAFIKGFNLKKGALASTVAHDSHNIIAIGTTDTDILRAIELIQKNKGALVAVNGSDETVLPLNVAGIMSNLPVENTAELYESLNQKAYDFGSKLRAPYMTLAFMSLLVIPEIKLGDKGLFDGLKFEFTDLFVD